MTSDDTLVSMLAVAASSRNSLFCKGKWGLETACAARDDASRYFSEGPFRILGLRFCRCVMKEQNQRRGPSFLQLAVCCVADPEIFKGGRISQTLDHPAYGAASTATPVRLLRINRHHRISSFLARA